MADQVTPYRNLAFNYQIAKNSGAATDAGKALSSAKNALKPFALVSKDYKSFALCVISESEAQLAALKKADGWKAKTSQSSSEYNIYDLILALYHFATAYIDSKKDDYVVAARQMKKVFKIETFKEFDKGATVEKLQAQLGGLDQETVVKVASWMETYKRLKAEGQVQAKINEMEKALKA